jgi:hypothetical protein
LKKNLPHKKTRVGTAEGPGIVIDGKILTQLVMVELEHDRRRIAVPIEELLDPETCPRPWEEVHVPDEPKPKRKRNRNRGKKEKTEASSGEKPQVEGAKKKKRRRRRPKKKNTENPEQNN